MADIGKIEGFITRFLLCLFISLIYSNFLFSQSYIKNLNSNLYLKNFTVRDGLSESNVNVIFKDSRGIAWIGTDGGLNRFNSYDFQVFKHDTSIHSISNNVIYDITEDEYGTIWIATSNGLNSYVPEINGFNRFFFSEPDNIQGIYYDQPTGSLFITNINEGLIQFDVRNHEHRTLDVFPPDAHVQRIHSLGKDSLVVGTLNMGLFLINTVNLSTRHLHSSSHEIPLSDDVITSLTTADNYLIVGTNNGLNILDLEKNSNTILSSKKGNFTSDLMVCTTTDKDGKIWVGTDGGGINVVDLKDFTYVNYRQDILNNNHLQSNVIREIYIDNDNNIWIGTSKKGFGIYNEKSNYLENIYIDPSLLKDFSNSSVTSFVPNSTGEMYLGLDGGGLLLWDGTRFKRIPLDPNCETCHSQKVLTVAFDQIGNLWLGTFAQGVICRLKNGGIKNFNTSNTPGLHSNSIWNIKTHPDGSLWLATNNGLTTIDPVTHRFTTFFPHNDNDPVASRQLRALCLDYNGNIWAGGYFGVFKFDKSRQVFTKNYHSFDTKMPLNGEAVISLVELEKDVLVFGMYGQGFQVVDVVNENFLYQEIVADFNDHVINFIAKGQGKNIWLGTNSGIVSIDLNSNTFNWYNSNNGLRDDEYNTGATLMINDTLLFVGGINGFSILDARKLNYQIINPPLQLENINYKENNLPLNPYTLDSIPVFEVPYSKSSMHITFTAIDHFNSNNIRFSYLLENFNPNWSEISDYRLASYSNLPPGKYHFQVKSYAFSNHPNRPVTLATIVVLPAWWMTVWFRVFIVFFFILLVMAIIQYRTNQHKNAEEKLLQAVLEKTSEIDRQKIELENINLQLEDIVKLRTEELNETINELNKTISELDRFVYSASHDLGAPLKSILGLINIAQLEAKDDAIKPHLELMKNSVLRLEDVISSLIQYSRNNRLDYRFEDVNLYELIEDSYDSLRFMNGYETIKLENHVDKNSIVYTDISRLKVIIRNLLSNSIKYADQGKSEKWIKVDSSSGKNKQWELSIADNGLGIEKAHIKNIFEMFYRASATSDGSGLGLYITKEAIEKLDGHAKVESQVGKGTTIRIRFGKVKHSDIQTSKDVDGSKS